MQRIALAPTAVLACLIVLAAAGASLAGDSKTVIVRNQTLATITVIHNGNMATERFVPPGSVIELKEYLATGRNELQFHLPCVQNASGAYRAVWVSGENADKSVVVLDDADFGMAAALDSPGCGVDKSNEDHGRCMTYAGVAVNQYVAMTRQACELTGSLWSDDYQEHFRWCLDADYETARANQSARAVALLDCEEKRAHRDYCHEYARSAVAQNEEAEGLECGYAGGAWQEDYQVHYRWCLGVDEELAEAGTVARTQDLNQCRDKMSRSGFCEGYANTAIEQFKQSQRMECGYAGAVWVDDFDHHYDWCMRVDNEEALAGTQLRTDGLAECAKQKNEGN